MSDFRALLFAVGLLLTVFALLMLLPALFGISSGHWEYFLTASAITLFVGGAMVLAGRGSGLRPGFRSAFLVTSASWVAVAAASALPLTIGGWSYTDAFFESMSGLTTTGSTVLVGLDDMDHPILIWRSLLQWVGGLGIVVMGILILPFLRVGGMQLFHTESSERSEKVVSRTMQLVAYTSSIYAALTGICFLAFSAGGMGAFDAFNHAMTTLSTGGFSTHDASFAHFGSPLLETIATVFMLAGALPFVLYIKVVRGSVRSLLNDQQVRGLLYLLLFAIAVLAIWLYGHGHPLGEAIRFASFNVVSLVTTTGFASSDYVAWGAFPVSVMILLMLTGGTTGSTSGSIKIFRLQVLLATVGEQFRRMIYPHAVVPRRYNGTKLTDDVVFSIIAFIVAYVLSIAAVAAALSFFGLDIITAFTGAATAIGNVGPGFGNIIGPVGTFTTLPDGAKWILAAGMLLGRLELFTVLILFSPAYWIDAERGRLPPRASWHRSR